jgi:hypothetical protein
VDETVDDDEPWPRDGSGLGRLSFRPKRTLSFPVIDHPAGKKRTFEYPLQGHYPEVVSHLGVVVRSPAPRKLPRFYFYPPKSLSAHRHPHAHRTSFTATFCATIGRLIFIVARNIQMT